MKCGTCGVKSKENQTCCDFCGATLAPDINTVSPNESSRGRVTENDIGGHKHTQSGCDTYSRPRPSPTQSRPGYSPPPRTINYQRTRGPANRKPPQKHRAKFFKAIPILIFLAIFFGIITYNIMQRNPEPRDPFDERASVTNFTYEFSPPNTLNFSVVITNNTSDIVSVSISITFYENENYTGGVSIPFQSILPNQTVTRNSSYTHYTISHVSTFKITGWTVFPAQ